MEPDGARPQNGVNHGAVATRASNQPSAKAEGKRDSGLQDLTLVENSIYKTSAECSNPVRDSYVVPGKCSLANCLFTNRFRYVVFTAHTFQIVFYRCMVNKDFD